MDLHRHGGADETSKGAALEVFPILGQAKLSCWCFRALLAPAIQRLGEKSKAPNRIASTATSTEP